MIILDTNVVSGLMRIVLDDALKQWLYQQPSDHLFTTAVTEAEIFYGIALLPEGRRRGKLHRLAEEIFGIDFAGKVLPFDAVSARHYADIAANRRRLGLPSQPLDTQIAAIAWSCGAAVATRNTADFEGYRPATINPWTD